MADSTLVIELKDDGRGPGGAPGRPPAGFTEAEIQAAYRQRVAGMEAAARKAMIDRAVNARLPVADVTPAGPPAAGLGQQIAAQLAGRFGLGQAAGLISSAGGAGAAGAGAGAGLAGAAAAAGPAGLAVAAAFALKEVQDKINEAARASVQRAGEAARSTASLDATALATQLEESLKTIPNIGPAAAEAVKQLRSFGEALLQTAQRLAPFSADLSVANAMREVAQVTGDIRRAQQLGPDLARFVEAQSRLSQAGQDTLATLLRPLIPRFTALVEGLAGALEVVDQAARKFLGEPAVAAGVDFVEEILDARSWAHRRAVGGRDMPAAPAVGPRAPLGGF